MTPTEHAEISASLNALRSSPASAQETISKADVNAAAQAVRDAIEGAKSALNAAIEGAVPGVFSAAQKKRLVAAVVYRFARDEES